MISVRKRRCGLCLYPWPTWVVADAGGLYFCSTNWHSALNRALEIAEATQPGTGVQVHSMKRVSNA